MQIFGWMHKLRTADVSSWLTSSVFGGKAGPGALAGLDVHLATLSPILHPPLRFFIRECHREGLPLTFHFEKEGARYTWTIAIDAEPALHVTNDSGHRVDTTTDPVSADADARFNAEVMAEDPIAAVPDGPPTPCAVAALLPGGEVTLQSWGIAGAEAAPQAATYTVLTLTEIDVHRWLKNCASKARQQLQPDARPD